METGVNKHQAIVSLVGLAVVFGGLYFILDYFGVTEVQRAVERAGIWAPFVFIMAKASTLVIAPLGGAPLYLMGGALFGFWKGVVLVMLGDIVGGTIAFYISRIFGRPVAEKFLGSEQRYLTRALRLMETPKGFLFTRICFSGIQEVAIYGAGLTRLSFVPFIIIHAVVNVIPVALLVGLGVTLTYEAWWILPLAYAIGVGAIATGLALFHLQIEKQP